MVVSSRLLCALSTAGLLSALSCGEDPQTLGTRGSGGGKDSATGGRDTGGAVSSGGAANGGSAHGGMVSGSGGSLGAGTSSGGALVAAGGGSGGARVAGGSGGVPASGGTSGTGGTSGSSGAASGGSGNLSTGGRNDAGGVGGEGGSGGSSAGSGAGGASDERSCGSVTCDATRICVAHRQLGGTRVVPDANGACPSGMHVEGPGGSASCTNDFAYECRTPMGCGTAPIACSCGASTCPSGYPTCRAPSALQWLDPSAVLVCELYAP
ncbi:MAG TPA: hypothetical protein VG937_16005 [Polyangiaceae bacterium]|jgi:hypothetical protein|nr:hypothetical protein [Polyangiaceae bacterium]